eukprot:756122-Hanusia_phi.AAC.1
MEMCCKYPRLICVMSFGNSSSFDSSLRNPRKVASAREIRKEIERGWRGYGKEKEGETIV